MTRYLGIDHGSKRLGLAVGDTDMGLATPLKQLDSSGSPQGDAVQFRSLIEEYGVDAIVMGLPINMDGTEGDQAKLVRRYGEALAKGLGLPLEFWDERLSSAAADSLLNEREELTTKKRKARRDALAAKTILQGFLDHRRDEVGG